MLELEPLSPTLHQKFQMKIMLQLSALHKQISFIGLRFFNVVGPFQSIDSDYVLSFPIGLGCF